jgi:hypothetical protein
VARLYPRPHLAPASRHVVGITAKDIAWCAQVDRARRERWASAGRLKSDPPFTEHDAVETAIAFAPARRGVSQKAAAVAWDLIRPDVQRLLIAGELDIWIVISVEGPRAWAVAGPGAAALQVDGSGRCWLVATDSAVGEARARYAELIARGTPVLHPVARLAERGTSAGPGTTIPRN